MENTTNYNLKKPGPSDYINIEDFNANADILDARLKAVSDIASAKYTKPAAGIPKSDFDPSIQTAVDNAARDASTTQKGLTQLSSATNSTSETTAATSKVVKDVNDALTSHRTNTANPHGVTKEQVGLGNVQNYGPATQAEAQGGTSNAKYMTPLRVKEAIEALASPIVIGSYTGTDSSSRTISLGFTPRRVNIYAVNKTTTATFKYDTQIYTGFTSKTSAGRDAGSIVAGGFTVYHQSAASGDQVPFLNSSSTVYMYDAIR